MRKWPEGTGLFGEDAEGMKVWLIQNAKVWLNSQTRTQCCQDVSMYLVVREPSAVYSSNSPLCSLIALPKYPPCCNVSHVAYYNACEGKVPLHALILRTSILTL